MVEVKFAWLLVFLTLMSGCRSMVLELDAAVNPRARCVLVDYSYSETNYGAVQATLTIKNIGNRPASHIVCALKAKDGKSTIVDSALATFAPGCIIMPGEKVVGKAIFFELTSLDRVILYSDITWLNR